MLPASAICNLLAAHLFFLFLLFQASGLVAGVLVTCLTHPLWLAKARMEMQAKEAEVGNSLFHRRLSPLNLN